MLIPLFFKQEDDLSSGEEFEEEEGGEDTEGTDSQEPSDTPAKQASTSAKDD